MKAIIETKRLILREFSMLDSERFYELNTDNEVMRYTGDNPFSSVLETELFIKSYQDYQKNGFGRWAVISKETNLFIGWCGLKLNEENLIDIGFRFFRNEWGKGYATESARAVLEFGFYNLKITQIIGRVSKDNKASINVLEKLGMNFWKDDSCQGIMNCKYYKISKNEYDNILIE